MGASGILQPRPGQTVLDFGALNINVPVPALNPGREAQLLRRIRELEEESRMLRVDNEKQVSRG
jgi:hypothetical protein